MKRTLGLFVTALFLSAASLASAKDYQVTGPVVDVKDDVIIVKKGTIIGKSPATKTPKPPARLKKAIRS